MKKLVEMRNQPYESEDLLQELLAKHPDLLAGGQMTADVPRRWLLVRRELGVPGGEGEASRFSLDHLFIDHDAIPDLIPASNRGYRKGNGQPALQAVHCPSGL